VAATQIYGVSAGLLVGASLLAKDVNDDACFLDKPGVHSFFASKLAPTDSSGFGF
jgi:hypothetical protein